MAADPMAALLRFLTQVRDHASDVTVSITGSGSNESSFTLGDLRQIRRALTERETVAREEPSDCEFCIGTGTDHTDPSLGPCPYCAGGRVAPRETVGTPDAWMVETMDEHMDWSKLAFCESEKAAIRKAEGWFKARIVPLYRIPTPEPREQRKTLAFEEHHVVRPDEFAEQIIEIDDDGNVREPPPSREETPS